MDTQIHTQTVGSAEETTTPHCQPASKWLTRVNDQNVHAPSRRVKAQVLKDQGGVPADHVLVRDHESQHDVPFADDAEVDLAQGNVFFSVRRCEYEARGGCVGPAKLALFIDDVAEITTRPDQTGRTLRELFGLSISTRLFRDLESPRDEVIAPNAPVHFADGPAFYTRRAETGLSITVNKQTFTETDGVKREMTGREIANLITDQPAEVKRLKGGAEIPVKLEETVKIEGCEEFEVIRCNVKGGCEASRIEREVAKLRENGADILFVSGPTPAVIYRGIKTRPGYLHLAQTDVLVPVPSAYPGSMLDGAYLPQGSPLLGRVEGNPQGTTIHADGRAWQLVSYHPHNGGGGPAWNPSRHGFHSYYSELLVWVQRARE